MEKQNGILECDLREKLQKEISSGNRSMRALAREANVPRTSISKFIRGETGLTLTVASALHDVLEMGSKLLEGSNEVQQHMRYAIENAGTGIYAISNYEVNAPLLKCIEDAALRGVPYRRLHQGSMTRQLETHIGRVAYLGNVEIHCAPEDAAQYQNLLIGDDTTITTLGADLTKHQSAMRFQGQSYSNQFLRYFDAAFSESAAYPQSST